MMKTDTELLTAYCLGDDGAMDELFHRHLDMSWRLARSFLGNAADADDVVQDAFVQVCRHAGSLRDGEQARSWILSIVHNCCKEKVRGDRRRKMRQQRHLEANPMEQQNITTPDDAVIQQEQVLLVQEALTELPLHERLPISLCYLEGLSATEIAETLKNR